MSPHSFSTGYGQGKGHPSPAPHPENQTTATYTEELTYLANREAAKRKASVCVSDRSPYTHWFPLNLAEISGIWFLFVTPVTTIIAIVTLAKHGRSE
jgi:hypothetical protein